MVYRETDHVRLLKERARTAVALAMEGRWADAVQLNSEILEACPDNLEALNRLGKALVELDQPLAALAAFKQALVLNPGNTIASKNIAWLEWAAEQPATQKSIGDSNGKNLTSKFFIGDSGKSAQVVLLASDHAGNPSPGTPITLERNGTALAATDCGGNRLGLVPPKLARRLISLMDGGNEYNGAVSGHTNGAVRVVLQEAFQHASQRAKVSFPASSPATVESTSTTVVEDPVPDQTLLEKVDPILSEEELELVGVGAPIDGGLSDDPVFPDLPDEEEPFS